MPAAASPSAPACPDTVIPNVQILPSAVGCWNAIAVQTVRLDTAYPPQGLLYMGYVQGAVYDAVTKLEGRYVPYEDFDVPPGVHVAGASRDAATAAAAYTMLTSTFLGLVPAAQIGLSTKYSDYLDALGGLGSPPVAAGVAVGQAAANGLIANRTGDRDESITFTPGPLTPGGWTFAPPPSLQSSQTPWLAVMTPFMLRERLSIPVPLHRRRFFERPRGPGTSTRSRRTARSNSRKRSPEQTAIAQFWNANAVNQSNQAFQDVAGAHGMDSVDAARLLAMETDLVDSDALIACWDSKYHYLFWRPVMAIRNAAIDGNPINPGRSRLDAAARHPQSPRVPGGPHVPFGRRGLHVLLRAPDALASTSLSMAQLTALPITSPSHRRSSGPVRWSARLPNPRVWGGLHYRKSTAAGLVLGRHVARWTLRRFFQPVRSKHHPLGKPPEVSTR